MKCKWGKCTKYTIIRPIYTAHMHFYTPGLYFRYFRQQFEKAKMLTWRIVIAYQAEHNWRICHKLENGKNKSHCRAVFIETLTNVT